jgi:hypothetical protein
MTVIPETRRAYTKLDIYVFIKVTQELVAMILLKVALNTKNQSINQSIIIG